MKNIDYKAYTYLQDLLNEKNVNSLQASRLRAYGDNIGRVSYRDPNKQKTEHRPTTQTTHL